MACNQSYRLRKLSLPLFLYIKNAYRWFSWIHPQLYAYKYRVQPDVSMILTSFFTNVWEITFIHGVCMVRDNLGIVSLSFCADVDIFLPHITQLTLFVFFFSRNLWELMKVERRHFRTPWHKHENEPSSWRIIKIKLPVNSPLITLISPISGSREIGYQV